MDNFRPKLITSVFFQDCLVFIVCPSIDFLLLFFASFMNNNLRYSRTSFPTQRRYSTLFSSRPWCWIWTAWLLHTWLQTVPVQAGDQGPQNHSIYKNKKNREHILKEPNWSLNTLAALINSVLKDSEQNRCQRAAMAESNSHQKWVWLTTGNVDQALARVKFGLFSKFQPDKIIYVPLHSCF